MWAPQYLGDLRMLYGFHHTISSLIDFHEICLFKAISVQCFQNGNNGTVSELSDAMVCDRLKQ